MNGWPFACIATEANLVIKLIQEAPNGYVPLDQLKQKYHDKYGKHLKRNKTLKWIRKLPGVYVDSDPVDNSIHIGANSGLTHHAAPSVEVEGVQCHQRKKVYVPPVRTRERKPLPNHPHHHAAIVKTLKSQNGRIALHEFKKEYKLVTNNIPPYPETGVRKWILSAGGVQIKKEVLQLMSTTMTDPKFEAPNAQQRQDGDVSKRKKGKKEKAKSKAKSPSDDLPTHTPKRQKLKKKGKRIKAKVKSSQCNLPIRNDCYHGMANHKVDTERRRECIMHFGSTSYCTKLWPGQEKKRLHWVSNGGSFSRVIVSGYMANKIKKSGGQKAARKTRNLARLRKKHNPTPAAPTPHALQRYKERGSHSSPIYKPIEGGKKAIVVTYLPIQRDVYSDAKKSSQTIQLEVDRMSQLSKKSDLPKSKLSSRDAYLFKLSNRAATKEECRRRSQQKERAYCTQCCYPLDKQWTPRSINTNAPHALHIHGRRKGSPHRHKPAARRSRKKTKKRPKKKKSVPGRAP
eukprot:scaffold9709_cov126-Skeletonema_dohrnii-CCMP3373.AAC.10